MNHTIAHQSKSRNGARREAQFRRVMAAKGIALAPPRRFRFKRCSYTPDFYSPSENVYYEVIGSRQRAEHNRQLLDLMDAYHPGVVVRPVHPNGKAYAAEHCQRLMRRWKVPCAIQLAEAMDARGLTQRAFARLIGVRDAQFTRWLYGAREARVNAAVQAYLTNGRPK